MARFSGIGFLAMFGSLIVNGVLITCGSLVYAGTDSITGAARCTMPNLASA